MEELKISSAATLSDLEIRMLDFERQWWKFAGTKDAAIKEHFEMPAKKYYEILNSLIDRDDALATSPLLIKRLRRLREARLERRFN